MLTSTSSPLKCPKNKYMHKKIQNVNFRYFGQKSDSKLTEESVHLYAQILGKRELAERKKDFSNSETGQAWCGRVSGHGRELGRQRMP